MTDRNYPLPMPEDDERFTRGLLFDTARLLTERGFPELTGRDFVELGLALFGFLYARGEVTA